MSVFRHPRHGGTRRVPIPQAPRCSAAGVRSEERLLALHFTDGLRGCRSVPGPPRPHKYDCQLTRGSVVRAPPPGPLSFMLYYYAVTARFFATPPNEEGVSFFWCTYWRVFGPYLITYIWQPSRGNRVNHVDIPYRYSSGRALTPSGAGSCIHDQRESTSAGAALGAPARGPKVCTNSI